MTSKPQGVSSIPDAISALGRLAKDRRNTGWTQEQQTEWFSDLFRDLPESELRDAAMHILDSVTGWCPAHSRLYPVAAPSVLSDPDEAAEPIRPANGPKGGAAPEGNEGALGAA